MRQQAERPYAEPVCPLIRGEKRTKRTPGVMCKVSFPRLDGVQVLWIKLEIFKQLLNAVM